jgi:hypothetical protein
MRCFCYEFCAEQIRNRSNFEVSSVLSRCDRACRSIYPGCVSAELQAARHAQGVRMHFKGEIMLRNLGCIGPQLMELTPSRYCEVCGFMQGLSQFVPAILIPI